MRNALLLLVATASTILALEFITRAIAPQQLVNLNRIELWRSDVDLGHRLRSNLNLQINSGERSVTLATDANGYRIDPDLKGKTGDYPNIRGLIIGDSFVEALQVDYEDTFAAILEKQLSQRLNMRVKIDNAGADDWAPQHYVVQARKTLAKQKYDFAIVSIFVGNDITKKRMIRPRRITNAKHVRLPNSLDFYEIRDSIIYPLNEWLESISHLHVLFKNATSVLRNKFNLGHGGVREMFLRTTDDSEAMNFTMTTLLELRDVFRANSLPVLFNLIPAKEQVELEWGYDMFAINGFEKAVVDFDGATNQLADRLQQEGIRTLNLLLNMRRSHKEEGINSHGNVDAHLSPAGHRIAAEQLLPAVQELFQGRLTAIRR